MDVGESAVAPLGALLVRPFCTAVGSVLRGSRWSPTGLPLASTVIVVACRRRKVLVPVVSVLASDNVTEYTAGPLAGVLTLTTVASTGAVRPSAAAIVLIRSVTAELLRAPNVVVDFVGAVTGCPAALTGRGASCRCR